VLRKEHNYRPSARNSKIQLANCGGQAYISYIGSAVLPVTLKETTMAKTQPQTPAAGHKAAQAARKPSKGTTTQAAPANAMQALAATVTAAPVATNAQGVPSPALRGLPPTLRVNPAQTYRTKAVHNLHWWQNIVQACQQGGGTVQTAALLAGAQGSVAGNYASATGAPGHFVGYAVRKGYLVAGA
jgi:hypothetical protein